MATGPADSPGPAEEALPPGAVVGGKYVVEEVLGVGGMGVVVAARHAQLGQRVAIKFLRREAARTPDTVDRFLREARAVVGLQSAHVVRVIDVGVHDEGVPFMVMEHLPGEDLARVLERRQTLPSREAVDYVLQAMEAVAEAHTVGIVHRDLKPANLFLTTTADGSPLVKVLDFGISKAGAQSGAEASLTATSTVMGTPLYMSPEQLRSSKNVDGRTDVWALGVIVYELVSGRAPFEAETATGLCAKIAADPPTPLATHVPTLDAGLVQVVMRCLEKDVARRYASVGELALALRPHASTEGALAADRIARIGGAAAARSGPSVQVSARPGSGPISVDSPTARAETQSTWQTAGAQRRKTATVAALGLGGAAVLAVAVVGAFRAGERTSTASHDVAAVVAPASPAPATSAILPPATSLPAVAQPPPPDVPGASGAVDAAGSAVPSARSAAPKPPRSPTARPPAGEDLLLERK